MSSKQLSVSRWNRSSPCQVICPTGLQARTNRVSVMHVSLFKSIARSLATLALGLSAEASIQAYAMEGSASAIEGSVAASSTEGSVAVSATDSLMAASTPITPVITIVASATTDIPATATASPISRLRALAPSFAKPIVARGRAAGNIQIVRRAARITRRAENQPALAHSSRGRSKPELFLGRARVKLICDQPTNPRHPGLFVGDHRACRCRSSKG